MGDVWHLDDMVELLKQPTLERSMSRLRVVRSKMPSLCKQLPVFIWGGVGGVFLEGGSILIGT